MAEPNGHIFDAQSAKRIAEVVRYVERMMANGKGPVRRQTKQPLYIPRTYVKLKRDLYRFNYDTSSPNAILTNYLGDPAEKYDGEEDPAADEYVMMSYRRGYIFSGEIIEVRLIDEVYQCMQDGQHYIGGNTNYGGSIASGSSAERLLNTGDTVEVYSPYGTLASGADFGVAFSDNLGRWEAVVAECS